MTTDASLARAERATVSYLGGGGQAALFWKGRVALYALLAALDVGDGDEIIVPGFTCVAVPNAIMYRGATPVYVDIDPETYTITAAAVEEALTPNTEVVLVQNSFGLAPDLDAINAVVPDDVALVEDCAHGLGGAYRGQPNGTVADAAFFSTQWSKPVSTGLGGIAYTTDDVIADALREVWQSSPAPTARERTVVRAQLLAYDLLFRPSLYWPLAKAYRFLTQRTGFMEGSSTSSELSSPSQPPGFEKRMGPAQADRLVSELAVLDERVARRRAHASTYDQWVAQFGLDPAPRAEYATHSFLRYPVEVEDKEAAISRAKERRVRLGTWFSTPIDPVEDGLARWDYEMGSCPVAESVCRRIVNLPTEQLVDRDDARFVLMGE
ncbi:DegT/DnrJ/EryC1/StrS family aminotransferase [Haloarchaeobius litoreus]|uniref:DegT/DnrJ/EryC1/StrS family aminotransferase n=1 Tax=Haloarchaeobius litoreus TaxID=755306 RepID=A0ABD6DJ24_9EURY|nr:aminotransferase class I/II-fold pyridoxal phosphate-dependent enzyme [Haloarchaeobius litoreus]